MSAAEKGNGRGVASRAGALAGRSERGSKRLTRSVAPASAASAPYGGERPAVARDEATDAIANAAAPRQNRFATQETLQVGRERRRREVALLRPLAQRLEADRVEVAGGSTPPPARGGEALRRRSVAFLSGAPRCGRRRFRVEVQHRALDLERRARARTVGPDARDELVEDRAGRVDVRRRVRRLATELLGARILRREGAQLGAGRRLHFGGIDV